MSSKNVTVARVYTMEGHDVLNQALAALRAEDINGVTVIRGIEGVGTSGELHTSSLLDLSLDLPLIIEFYDVPDKIEKAILALQSRFEFKHIVSWPATAYLIDSNS